MSRLLDPKIVRTAAELSDKPPEEYDISIAVRPHGDSGVKLKVVLPGIKRADILKPDYPKEIRSLVEFLENAIWGTGEQFDSIKTE